MTSSQIKKDTVFTEKGRKAFRFFYDEVKKYYAKKYKKEIKVSYADICDCITGHLSTDGGYDREWLLKERTFGGFSKDGLITLEMSNSFQIEKIVVLDI